VLIKAGFVQLFPVPPFAMLWNIEHTQHQMSLLHQFMGSIKSRAFWRDCVLVMRLNAPVGWILLALPGFWGFAWACPHGDVRIMGWIILGAIWARSLGCFYNDWVDRGLDAKVERTRQRPLVSAPPCQTMRILMAFIALFGGIIFMACLPWSCTFLALFGGLGVLIYPWSKRFTHYPQVLLGFLFNLSLWMPPLIAQALISTGLCVLYIYGVLWTISYDTVYAFQDFHDDQRFGIGSLAVKTGPNMGYRILGGLIVVRFALLALLAFYSGDGGGQTSAPFLSCFGGAPAAGVHYGLLALMMGYQVWQWWHWDVHDGTMCHRAFKHSVYEGYTSALWVLLLSGGLGRI
jgi:4-hydroxybenzoate polyprenyltransferase